MAEHNEQALRAALEGDLVDLVLSILKIDREDFSMSTPLMDYGLDSIASTDIGNRFAEQYGIVIPPTVFFEFQELSSFCGYLLANHATELNTYYADRLESMPTAIAHAVVAPAPAPSPAPVVSAPIAEPPPPPPVVETVIEPPPVTVSQPPPAAAVAQSAEVYSLEDLWDKAADPSAALETAPVAPQAAVAHRAELLDMESLWQEDAAEAPAAPVHRLPTSAPAERVVSEPSRELLDAMQAEVDKAEILTLKRPGSPALECALYGQGEPILLIGGLVMHYSVMWRLQLKALGASHRLIMLHMPGCGGAEFYDDISLASLSADINDLLDAVGVHKALPVIGYSFGGVLAQQFCLDHPERCASLAITVSSATAEGANNFPVLMRELQKSPRFMEINRGWSIPSLPAYERISGGFDFRDRLAQLSVPLLVISGGRDQYMTRAYAERIVAAAPQARHVCFDDAGHLLGFTHHEAYNRLLQEFLARQSLPRAPGEQQDAGVFTGANADGLRVMEDYVRNGEQGHCAILSPAAAQLGLLLNTLVNSGQAQSTPHKCFFLSSQQEALDAGLRLARHRARNADPHSRGEIVFIDQGRSWRDYFNPLGLDSADALVPGMHFVTGVDEAFALDGVAPVACVLVLDGRQSSVQVEAFIRRCREHKAVSIVLEDNRPGRADWLAPQLSEAANMLVFGESLTAGQLPVGACVVREGINQPWMMTPNESYVRNVMTNFGLALTVAREHLLDRFAPRFDATVRQALRRIESSQEETYQAHLDYVNPGYAKVSRLHGFDARFYEARGMRSRIRFAGEEPREILDCFVNVGTAPRGLNPLDVADEVLGQHDPQRDYWAELSRLLARRTGLPQALPAVSNVTAVESALSLAALASPKRQKMLFFCGGLGFTLLSAASSYDKVFDIFRRPFMPIYPHSVFIDPADPNAAAELERELLSGEIGLVWFETIQVDANATRALPKALIELVNKHRSQGGYLVGVDETQTNLMTGRLLHSEGLVNDPDIVALGTALCDSLIPAGVVLAKDAVVQNAQQSNPQRLADLQQRHRNPLTAHISLHSLERIFADGLDERARRVGRRFQEGLKRLQRDIPLICDVRGEGLLLTMQFDLVGHDPFIQRSFGYLFWGAMLRDPEFGVASAVCPIHNDCIRFLPPLTISETQIDAILANVRRVLHGGVPGVMRNCADYCRRRGDARTADYFLSLIDQPSGSPDMSANTSFFTQSKTFRERIPGGQKSLDALAAQSIDKRILPKVCIVGAGVGGLATAKALTDYGIPFDCFERRDCLGGIWAFDESGEHTSVWYHLNQNTPKGLYQFSDFPMPADYPDFPSHRQVLDYLESYVEHFNFRERIHLNTSVRSAKRQDNGIWEVTLDSGEVRQYDAFVVANGHHNTPNFPDYHERDQFDGHAIHSQQYRYRYEYRDKKVLVVGIGNSGSQIAVDVSHEAKSTLISLRRGVYVLPHYLFGMRMDKAMMFLNDWWVKKILPYPLFGLMFTGMYKLFIAKRKQMGMPKPDHLMMASLPTLSENFANRIGDGKLKIVPEVKSIDGHRVNFADGSSEEVDAIIYSTGYQTDFPFLDEDFLKIENNRIPLYQRMFMPGVDNIAFIGLFQAVTWGFLDMMEKQANVLAEYLSGFYRLPSVADQQKAIAKEQKVIEKEYLQTLRNNYEMHGPTYMHYLDVEWKQGRKRALAEGLSRPVNARIAIEGLQQGEVLENVASGAEAPEQAVAAAG